MNDASNLIETKLGGSTAVKQWIVSPTGDLTYEPRAYTITADRLNEEDWFLHMMTKGWCDMSEFVPTYFKALQNADVQTVLIRSHY
ncbi:hypothetical protein J2I47_07965 [Fibrella sp. HMF5335]|uniref:Uncharacterized protein n=1 Tax=Fibrella rubiginis TaxID=2817060 RepID=A0A939K5H6_9BACT|nr:hypothetical protein [Fibrella rubiginis]MBO0936475.1 hypothetical protein [Fibrella rubiginis]